MKRYNQEKANKKIDLFRGHPTVKRSDKKEFKPQKVKKEVLDE